MNIWDFPIYDPTYAGKLVGISPGRVKRWLEGYEYKYHVGSDSELRSGEKKPVVKRTIDTPYATFLDLIDLLFVKQFLDYGISLQKLRLAFDEASKIFGGHHFAQRKFFNSGKNIYMKVKGKSDAMLELLSDGQWVIANIIEELSYKIEFDIPTEFAKKWYPFGPDGLIVLDPGVSFGNPTIVGKRISTFNIYDLYLGENQNTEKVCDWFNIKDREVDAAVKFELSLKAA
jgi:uncharacterized protein (DUF433 family)